MNEMQRPSSNMKFFEHENDAIINIFDDDTDRKTHDDAVVNLENKPVNKLLRENTTTVQILSMKTFPKIDFIIESNTNDNDSKVEPIPILPEQQDKSTSVDLNDKMVKKKVNCKNLSEYLHEHERFLKLIEYTKRLKRYEQNKLDIQKANLKKLQNRLNKEIEEINFKRQYEKKKQTDALRNRRTYLRRRMEESQLKESRKPIVQTTLFVSIKPLSLKSELIEKKKTDKSFESPSLATINQSKSTSYMSTRGSTRESQCRTNVACQTLTSYSDVLFVDRQLKDMKKHFKGPPKNIGKNLEELIIQFVEHSKLSWKND